MTNTPAVDIDDIFPFSALQQGILFHGLSSGRSALYLEQLSCEIRGRLEPERFVEAWNGVLHRHSVLRSGIQWRDVERPVHVVYGGSVSMPHRLLDWTSLAPETHEQRFEELIAEDLQAGFDFESPPLLRLCLVRTSQTSWKFLFTFHHLLVDGWSCALIVREAIQRYQGSFDGGSRAPRFRDYITWYQSRGGPSDAYWTQALADYSGPTPLPIPGPPKGGRESHGLTVVELNDSASKVLADCARQQGVLLSAVANAAWAVVLSRISGEATVTFGAVCSGRTAPLGGIENTVGCLINTLPMCVTVRADESASELLCRMNEDQLELLKHEHTSLPEVRRIAGVAPAEELFNSFVAFESHASISDLSQVGGEISAGELGYNARTNFPLSIYVAPGANLRVSIRFRHDQFHGTAIRELAEQITRAMTEMASNPAGAVGDLELLSATARDRLIDSGLGPVENVPPATVAELVQRRAEAIPDAIAVRSGDERMTYRGLVARANELAAALEQVGAVRGSRVAILASRSCDSIAGFLGVLEVGAAYVPIDADHPDDRIAWMLEDSGATVALCDAASVERLKNVAPQVSRVCVDDEHPASTDLPRAARDVTPSDLAYVIYTSGSTGTPKGTRITHRNLVSFLVAVQRELQIGPTDIVAQLTTWSFDISGLEIWLPLVEGASIALVPRAVLADPQRLKAVLEQHACSVIQGTPTSWRLLQEVGWRSKPGQKLIVGGEELPIALSEFFVGEPAQSWNAYGPTEATIWATLDAMERTPVTIGRPLANYRVYILDAHGHLAAPGFVGEIALGGAGVGLGYLNRPELTRERFLPDPFAGGGTATLYLTGDRGRWCPDGTLEFLGRFDDQIKLRGHRVEPAEIEHVLESHAAVRTAKVVASVQPSGSLRLVAFCVLERDACEEESSNAATIADIRAYGRTKLPGFMVPAVFEIVSSMPLTPNGKIDVKALSASTQHARAIAAPLLKPEGRMEEVVCEIWRKVLGVVELGRDDNFFDLGGDSLSLLKAHGMLQSHIGRDIELVDLFDNPTARSLAVAVSSNSSGVDEAVAAPLDRSEGRRLISRRRRLNRADPTSPE